MKFTIQAIFKCTVRWPWAHSRCYAAVATLSLQDSFCLAKLELWTHKTLPPHPPLPSLQQPPFYALSLWHSLFLGLHTSEIRQHCSFCGWLISLSIISSRFIHIVAGVRISCLLKLTNIPLWVCTTFCFWFIHLSKDTWGYFHSFVNNVAVNIGVKYLFETLFLIYTPKWNSWIIWHFYF